MDSLLVMLASGSTHPVMSGVPSAASITTGVQLTVEVVMRRISCGSCGLVPAAATTHMAGRVVVSSKLKLAGVYGGNRGAVVVC
jgi:hypothetical protein